MVALNFQKQFADDVEAGRKTRSIRAPRKDGRVPQKGELAHLFTAMRSKACRKIGLSIVVRVRPIEIDHTGVKIDGRILYAGDTPAYQGGPDAEHYDGDFARADGFDSFSDMADWFLKNHGLPFSGYLIEWLDPHTYQANKPQPGPSKAKLPASPDAGGGPLLSQ